MGEDDVLDGHVERFCGGVFQYGPRIGELDDRVVRLERLEAVEGDLPDVLVAVSEVKE